MAMPVLAELCQQGKHRLLLLRLEHPREQLEGWPKLILIEMFFDSVDKLVEAGSSNAAILSLLRLSFFCGGSGRVHAELLVLEMKEKQ